MVMSCRARRPTASSTGRICRGGPGSRSLPGTAVTYRGFPLAGPADTAVLGRIGFPAQRADDYGAPMALAQNCGRTWTCCHPRMSGSGLADLGQQQGGVLCFLGVEFEIPVMNLRPVGGFRRVQEIPAPRFPRIYRKELRAKRPTLTTLSQPLPMVQGVRSWMASGRQLPGLADGVE